MGTCATYQDVQAMLAAGGDVDLSGVSLTLPSPLTVDQPDTRVRGGRFHVTDGPAFEVGASGVELVGQRIVGGRGTVDSYSGSQKLIHAVGTAEHPLTDVVVRNCRLSGSRGDNIWVQWCEDAAVSRNQIASYLYSGVMVISGTRVTVDTNNISDAPLLPGATDCYGIAFTDLANTAAARSRDCAATGNTVRLIDREGIDSHGGDGIRVSHNTVIGCPRGIALVVGNETRTEVPTRSLVTGNLIDGAGARMPLRHAIWLGGLAGKPADGIVTGNQITGYDTPGSAPFGLPYVDRVKTTVVDNTAPLVPWTPIDLTGSDFIPNATYPPEYMVDGHTVWLRGAVIPKTTGLRTYVGVMPSAFARPSALTWWAYTKGTNPAAGGGTLTVYTDGAIRIAYGTGTDTWSYPLTGSFRAA